jgi:hypothetical protein
MKTTESGMFECEAELVGGPDDGFRYTMFRTQQPVIGTKRVSDGKQYRLIEFRNEVAIFKYVPNH